MKYISIFAIILLSIVLSSCFEQKPNVEENTFSWSTSSWELDSSTWSQDSLFDDELENDDEIEATSSEDSWSVDAQGSWDVSTQAETPVLTQDENEVLQEYEADLEALFQDILKDE
jgi:hypothetical protein